MSLGTVAAADRDSRLARAALGSGAGTVASRLTGLLRLAMVAYALGGSRILGDAFNLANNTPNMIFDLVLGGVLAATFVSVFVDRLATRPAREATTSISAVLTVSAVVLLVTTVLFELAAPLIVDLYTLGATGPGVASERSLATELLRFFAPQLAFYGVISLTAAVLATRDRFGAVGAVPIVNNVVGIIVLAIFAAMTHGQLPAQVSHNTAAIVFLGIGTTLGVALQAGSLWPVLRRSGARLRWCFRPRDPAVRAIFRLSGWTFGFVAGNQLALFIALALAGRTTGGVSAYTYAFTFFMFPFAVVAVAIVNVATPDFARAHVGGDLVLLGQRFGRAARQILALILPAMVGYLLLARPAMVLVIQHHREGPLATQFTASVLVMFALGLPGFCLFFLAIRAFQAMQDTKTAFVLYGIENGINLLLAFLIAGPLGYHGTALVRGLALAYSIAYTIGAAIALVLLRERLGTIGGRALLASAGRDVAMCAVMALVLAFLLAVLGTETSLGTGLFGWIRLLFTVGVGLGVYLGCAGLAALAHAWQTSRRRRGPPLGRVVATYQSRHR